MSRSLGGMREPRACPPNAHPRRRHDSRRSGRARLSMAFAAIGATLVSCQPDLDDRVSLVEAPRILAVRADPAEGKPGDAIALSALVVAPDGTSTPTPSWAVCTARKPLSELGPVNPACVRFDGEAVAPLGDGIAARLTMPRDACQNFGPDRPPPKDGEPAGRPLDPDGTGGYYQPIVVRTSNAVDATSTFDVRVTCGLPDATQDIRVAYEARRHPNTNPGFDQFVALRAGETRDLRALESDGGALDVASGERLVLRVAWSPCATEDPCTGAELYPYVDPATRALGSKREWIHVSWYGTLGAMGDDRTGRESDDPETTTETTWTAPSSPGRGSLHAVLRDARGGVAFQSVPVVVR